MCSLRVESQVFGFFFPKPFILSKSWLVNPLKPPGNWKWAWQEKWRPPFSEVQGCCIQEGEGRGCPSRPWGQGDRLSSGTQSTKKNMVWEEHRTLSRGQEGREVWLPFTLTLWMWVGRQPGASSCPAWNGGKDGRERPRKGDYRVWSKQLVR